jgi:hypothetical protein
MKIKTGQALSDKLDGIFKPEFDRILKNSLKKLWQKKFLSEIIKSENKDEDIGTGTMSNSFISHLIAESKLTNQNLPLDLTVHLKVTYYIEDNLYKKTQKKAKSASKSKKTKLSLVKK